MSEIEGEVVAIEHGRRGSQLVPERPKSNMTGARHTHKHYVFA
jgi:hypothetical protein